MLLLAVNFMNKLFGILGGIGERYSSGWGSLLKSQQLLGHNTEAVSHLLRELGLLETDLEEMPYHRIQVGGVGSVSDARILHQWDIF